MHLECQYALGMENGEISDEEISASTQWNDIHAPILGLVHPPEAGGRAGWAGGIRDANQWLQVDLKKMYTYVMGA